jgi:hypothetical protein
MKHFLVITLFLTVILSSGCHKKLSKNRCGDCPKWNKMDLPKKVGDRI